MYSIGPDCCHQFLVVQLVYVFYLSWLTGTSTIIITYVYSFNDVILKDMGKIDHLPNTTQTIKHVSILSGVIDAAAQLFCLRNKYHQMFINNIMQMFLWWITVYTAKTITAVWVVYNQTTDN